MNIVQGVSDEELTEIISDEINVDDVVVLEDKSSSKKQREMRMRMPR